MPDALPLGSLPSVFSPLAKALLDGFSEGVIVFDVEGRLLYANQQAREALVGMDLSEHAPDLMPRLAALGDANNWKLAETAKHLGISRTTLWRRLKAYGLHRDGRSKWAQTS
jgi:nitrogen fixation/metabolism regulation signal transduction histidine kinase